MSFVSLVTDSDTIGSTTWSPGAMTKFTINGTPVALMGDVGTRSTISAGSVKITVGGKPVAYVGCATTGGVMLVSTNTKVVVSV